MKFIKNTTIAIIILLSSFTMQAQKWKLENLRNLNKISMDEFKTQMKEVHKYSYYDKIESEMYNLFEYESADFVRKIGKFVYPDANESNIDYCTKDKTEFAAFKANLIKLGYKVIKSGVVAEFNYSDLKKGTDTIRMLAPKVNPNNNEYYSILIY